jgi:hypothetical protein
VSVSLSILLQSSPIAVGLAAVARGLRVEVEEVVEHGGAEVALVEQCVSDPERCAQLEAILADELAIRCAQSHCLYPPSDLACIAPPGGFWVQVCVNALALACLQVAQPGRGEHERQPGQPPPHAADHGRATRCEGGHPLLMADMCCGACGQCAHKSVTR